MARLPLFGQSGGCNCAHAFIVSFCKLNNCCRDCRFPSNTQNGSYILFFQYIYIFTLIFIFYIYFPYFLWYYCIIFIVSIKLFLQNIELYRKAKNCVFFYSVSTFSKSTRKRGGSDGQIKSPYKTNGANPIIIDDSWIRKDCNSIAELLSFSTENTLFS